MPTIQVKEAFTLTHQDRSTTEYGVGAHTVSDEVAGHWYVQHFIQAPAAVSSDTSAAEAEAAAAVLAKEKAESEAATAAADKAKAEAEAAAVAAAAAQAGKAKS